MVKESSLLYIRVKEALVEDIASLKPDQRLPSRTALVNKFNVTRTTIDRAISELIGEGYLYSRDGSGTYVAMNSERSPRLTMRNNSLIGVVLPSIMHDTYQGILRAIEDTAHKNGINVIICNTDNYIEKQGSYINKLVEAEVGGIVIVPALIGQFSWSPFDWLRENNIPFVFCNRGIPGLEAPLVVASNFYGGYLATKHLIDQGHRLIAFVSRPLYSSTLDRYQGYICALAEANIELNEEYVMFEESFINERPGFEVTQKVLRNNPRPDAILSSNDMVTLGAYEAIIANGLRVGADIGLVGNDNEYSYEGFPVKLTSIKFNALEIGSRAADLLIKIMRGESISRNKTEVLVPYLLVRESSSSKLI